MKTLILIRHAKSSWKAPVTDVNRSLSKRGIVDAHLMAPKLGELLPKTFIVWSSIANRTKETALIFSEFLAFSFEDIIFKKDLYTFDIQKLESEIKKCENVYNNLILFGHNDAITNFVNKFGNTFIENVPTTGIIKIEFKIDSWVNLLKGNTIKAIFPSHFKYEQQQKSIH